MKTRQQEITEKETNSWTPVGPTRASGTNRHTEKSLGRSRDRVWGPTRRRATKEGRKDLTVIKLFSLPLGVWEGLWLVIAAPPALFSYLFLTTMHVVWHI